MTVLGIVAEYNPFHNGHLYHLEKSKEISGADFTVCVMSGNFIQRGGPAIADKWARTEMALLSGIDLVVELPVLYALASAEFFAFGAVKILDSLGVTDYISFGSEAGSLDILDNIASVLADEPEGYKKLLKDAMDCGISYPSARQSALADYLGMSSSVPDGRFQEVLSSSNNILGIEYLKALKKLSSKMKPITVQRINAAYNEERLTGTISSATSIRRHIELQTGNSNNDSGLSCLYDIMPEAAANILDREIKAGRAPIFPSDFDMALLSLLRKMSIDEIKMLPYVSEGLENRISQAAATAGSFDDLVDKISTKRFTRTRIQRILFSAVAGISALDLEAFSSTGGPCFIRVLGFNQKGRRLMSEIKKKAKLPIIMKTADFKKHDNPLIPHMLRLESAATDQYMLACPEKSCRKAGQEFERNVVRIV